MALDPRTSAGAQQSIHSKASPTPLQTQGVARNPRFSYMETPDDILAPVAYAAPSPTNSTIDESPTSPVSRPSDHAIPSATMHSTYPAEKGIGGSTAAPNTIPYPEQPHPAQSAPYAEDTIGTSRQRQDRPERLAQTQASIPISLAPDDSLDSKSAAGFVTPNHESYRPTLSVKELVPDIDHRPHAYNPQSLAGPNVAVETHRPGQISHPNANVDPHWKHSLCEFDATCCVGLWCPCLVYGKTQYRLSQKAQKKDATDLLGYQSCNGSCALMVVACGAQC